MVSSPEEIKLKTEQGVFDVQQTLTSYMVSCSKPPLSSLYGDGACTLGEHKSDQKHNTNFKGWPSQEEDRRGEGCIVRGCAWY
jgi:hypothetical protein